MMRRLAGGRGIGARHRMGQETVEVIVGGAARMESKPSRRSFLCWYLRYLVTPGRTYGSLLEDDFRVLFSGAGGFENSHALSWPKSTLLAVIALVVFQGVFLIFNR
jgi:hypothetical protein